MRLTRTYCALSCAAALTLCCAPGASAQSDQDFFQQFQWNFSAPGARAAGMGGAFIGTSGDASTAITNPAGMTSLTRPQIYLEAKRRDINSQRLASAKSFQTGQTTPFGEPINSVGFLSLTIPVGSRLAVALTRHEFLNYRESFALSPRFSP